MGYKRTLEVANREERLQNAISAYNNQEFNFIRATATAFNVSHVTITRRLTGGLLRV